MTVDGKPTRRRKSKSAAGSGSGNPEVIDPDRELRELARRHSAAAIAALACVVSDTEAPAGARITAATTLLGWAFGREGGDGAGKGQGARKPSSTEQVIRLAWMETKAKRRGKARSPKTGSGKTRD
jgi:hypothetical protein